MASNKEPKQLRDGKAFHDKVQKDWEETAEGKPVREKHIIKPSGRKGRIDIHVDVDDGLVAVVEIKNSDWDKMTLPAVRRNVRRQAKQVWDYIHSQLEGLGDDQSKDVSPGIVFPKRPSDGDRMMLIEELFEAEGIPVVWEDETIEERKTR